MAEATLPPIRRAGAVPFLRRAAVATLDLLLPPGCLTCDAVVERQGQVCAACFSAIGFIVPPLCGACGVPFGTPGMGALCRHCAARPPPFGRARGALRYDAAARRLILPLKYAGRTELAEALAPHMARAGAALLDGADVLVPVPLHRLRLLRRRYNQAALLARAVGRLAGRPVLPDALRRHRATPTLGDRPAAERAAAVSDAIVVRPARLAAVAGRRVLLVDDVLTTGATAGACARALLAAGAASVDVLVAARVPDSWVG